jgi:hypothetical protein
MKFPRSTALSFVTLGLMAGAAFAQSSIGVISSVGLGSTILKGVSYTIQLSIGYPSGTGASSFISAAQLNSDFQGFVAAYPTAGDPPEGILQSALASILSKYPQMAGGSLFGTSLFSAPATLGPQLPVPQISSIQIFQGTFVAGGGFVGLTGIASNGRAEPKAPANR